MDLEEYREMANADDSWAPGWDAIEECVKKVYGAQEPTHFATDMAKRAIFGGDQCLDGFSVYTSEHGYLHIVTFGMSELYANEEAFGGEYSKWGYEMTIKLPICEEADYKWAIDLLSNLAWFTFTFKKFLEPGQYISSGGMPIKADSQSKITGLAITTDTELEGVDTPHGRLDFIQVVGVTQHELDQIISNQDKALELVEKLKEGNEWLITDLEREKDLF